MEGFKNSWNLNNSVIIHKNCSVDFIEKISFVQLGPRLMVNLMSWIGLKRNAKVAKFGLKRNTKVAWFGLKHNAKVVSNPSIASGIF